MEFTGRLTVGTACGSHACGASGVRFVFSPDAVWLDIIRKGRLLIYGDAPRQVQAPLLRNRKQIAWHGPVKDVTHSLLAPVPVQTIPVAVDRTAGASHLSGPPRGFPVATNPVPGGPPRLSIAPR